MSLHSHSARFRASYVTQSFPFSSAGYICSDQTHAFGAETKALGTMQDCSDEESRRPEKALDLDTQPEEQEEEEEEEESGEEMIARMTREKAVMVFSRSTCCMSHVVKRLLCGLGVNPTVLELDKEGTDGAHMEKALRLEVPVVFIGGELVGGLDRLMALHIEGQLVPKLKHAGALWL